LTPGSDFKKIFTKEKAGFRPLFTYLNLRLRAASDFFFLFKEGLT
jgi:hypothetical protein